jgi:hypothetical protein
MGNEIVYIKLPPPESPLGGLTGFTSKVLERKKGHVLVDYPLSFGHCTHQWVPEAWVAWTLPS